MTKTKPLKMDEINLYIPENTTESEFFYQMLCNNSMVVKRFKLEVADIMKCLHHASSIQCTLTVLMLTTGSVAEGTDITSHEYDERLSPTAPRYLSDQDEMLVLCEVRVIDKREMIPQRFSNHIYLQAERGEHTADGFRKLRIIHTPKGYSERKLYDWVDNITKSVEHGYMSSSKFIALESDPLHLSYKYSSIQTGVGTQGPSQIIERNGSPKDYVTCFYVKTWPKEAESWFSRQTNWPEKELKSKIKKIGYLLVPTGNRKSQESDLEWRCSFSIAEKILFRSMTNFQRCTFFMLKMLLKEYLPSHINTDGEKQLLSTYHIKTLFLWSLEDGTVKWEPEHLLGNIAHMFDKLMGWIHRQYFPHYFMPTINLLDGERLHGRQKSLISSVSAIRNDLSDKIEQSQFFMSQVIKKLSMNMTDNLNTYYFVMKTVTGVVQSEMHMAKMDLELNDRHSHFIDGLISIKPYIDPQAQHFYRAMYSDNVHDKLLTETVPGLIDQYRSSLLLAKYCMAARDGHVLPAVLPTVETLLKDTLHLDPCSGHVKLACLYLGTGNFVQAMDSLHTAENNFLLTHKNMVSSATATELYTDYTDIIHEVFKKWVEGQLACDIVVTWPEYITVPDLLQFELIHERTQHCGEFEPGKKVMLEWFLQYPPLSLIRLLKFVCNLYSGRSSTNHMEYLVKDLIASGLSVAVVPRVNNIHRVFNMAAWCYIKMKKYKPATHMMTVAIGIRSRLEIMKRCTFSHHFTAYVIAQCLASKSRVLVYKRDDVWPEEVESRFSRDDVWKQEVECWLQERQCLATGSRVLVYKRDNVEPQEADVSLGHIN